MESVFRPVYLQRSIPIAVIADNALNYNVLRTSLIPNLSKVRRQPHNLYPARYEDWLDPDIDALISDTL